MSPGDLFREWEDFDRVGGGLVAEASGWGRGVDLADDDAVLAWAREYLPRILAHADTAPNGALR